MKIMANRLDVIFNCHLNNFRINIYTSRSASNIFLFEKFYSSNIHMHSLSCQVDLEQWMNFLKRLHWCKQEASRNFLLYYMEKNTTKNYGNTWSTWRKMELLI